MKSLDYNICGKIFYTFCSIKSNVFRDVPEIVLEGGWVTNICPRVQGILDFNCLKGGGSSLRCCPMEDMLGKCLAVSSNFGTK